MNSFIIDKHLVEIEDAIGSNDAVVIRADTGSGKTIKVPYHLAFHAKNKRKIICSVPTVTSTIAATNFQRKLAGDQSDLVGYSCEGNKHYDDNTKIVYCTTGHLLTKMMSHTNDIINKGVKSWFANVLILDEFHIRTCHNDIILCIWLVYYDIWKRSPDVYPAPPNLVIMSATIDGGVTDLLKDVSTVKVLSYSVPSHIVTTHYSDESYPLVGDHLYMAACKKAIELHNNDKTINTYLIFVPGKGELELIVDALTDVLKDTVTILGIHGEMESSTIMDIMNTYDNRKIIVATNIAECSITIPGVSVVIDTMCHRVARSSIDENQSLDIEYISKSNSGQRRGRTGRTCSGDYYMMTTENNFNNLSAYVEPELSRVSITYEILKLCKYGFNPINVLRYVLDESVVINNINILIGLGFISEGDDNPFDASSMGEFCSKLPLSVKKSSMLYHLNRIVDSQDAYLYLAVVCTLSITSSGLFYGPRRGKGESKDSYRDRINEARSEYFHTYAGNSDVDTLINVWFDLINEGLHGDLRKFCTRQFINYKQLREILQMVKRCQYALDRRYTMTDVTGVDKSVISDQLYEVLVKTHPYDTHHVFDGIIRTPTEYKIDHKGIRLSQSFERKVVMIAKCSFNAGQKIINLATMIHC